MALKASHKQTNLAMPVCVSQLVVLVLTEKVEVEVAVCPLTVTKIVPVVAPAGIVTVSVVAVAAVTVAVTPLITTVLLDAVVLKLVPVITMLVPVVPLDGVKLVMVGAVEEVELTVKSEVEVAV